MKRRALMIGVAAGVALSAAFDLMVHDDTAQAQTSRPGPTTQPAVDTAGINDSLLVFHIEVGNRMYPDWKDDRVVRLEEPFHLGDTEFWAAASQFLPDFRIGPNGAMTVSRQWKNPALRVIVFQDSAAVDTAWAFQKFPPHFSARSFFTFKLLEILPANAPAGSR